MSEFTKGPWEVVNETDVFGPLGGDSGNGVLADNTDGWQVADCAMGITFVNGEQFSLPHAVQAANAKLISAAPDLHQAAQMALNVMRYLEPAPGYYGDLKRAMAAVEYALARAEEIEE